MSSKVIGELLRSKKYADALIWLQQVLARVPAISPAYLALRSHILLKLGQTDAAKADLEQALLIDPLDGRCLNMACEMWPTRATEYATRLLQSQFSQRDERQQVVLHLKDEDCPFTATTIFPTTVRTTVVVAGSEPMSVDGQAKGDFEEILQSRKAGRFAVDFFFRRDKQQDRVVNFHSESGWQKDVSIPALETVRHNVESPTLFSFDAKLWLLIPVHNGAKTIEACLKSVATALEQYPEAHALIIDDCSKDNIALAAIDMATRHPRIHLHRLDENLGFTGAVNTGLAVVSDGPVFLLNSDTYLPKNSLPRLMAHIADKRVGTVTPFSNNGGSFSLPQPRKIYKRPSQKESEVLANLAFRLNAGQGVDVLTGNGFAMLISAGCRRALPFLTEDFESGYYEDVDYGLRAAHTGFRNICATDCFVAHTGSQSFGARKALLAATNLNRLERVFPKYSHEYGQYEMCDPLKPARSRISKDMKWHPVEVCSEDHQSVHTVDLTDLPPDQITTVLPLHGPFDPEICNPHFDRLLVVSAEAMCVNRLRIHASHGFSLSFESLPHGIGLFRLCNGDGIQMFRTEISNTSMSRERFRHLEERCLEIVL